MCDSLTDGRNRGLEKTDICSVKESIGCDGYAGKQKTEREAKGKSGEVFQGTYREKLFPKAVEVHVGISRILRPRIGAEAGDGISCQARLRM